MPTGSTMFWFEELQILSSWLHSCSTVSGLSSALYTSRAKNWDQWRRKKIFQKLNRIQERLKNVPEVWPWKTKLRLQRLSSSHQRQTRYTGCQFLQTDKKIGGRLLRSAFHSYNVTQLQWQHRNLGHKNIRSVWLPGYRRLSSRVLCMQSTLLTWKLCTTMMCLGGGVLFAWFTTMSLFSPGIRHDDSTS